MALRKLSTYTLWEPRYCLSHIRCMLLPHHLFGHIQYLFAHTLSYQNAHNPCSQSSAESQDTLLYFFHSLHYQNPTHQRFHFCIREDVTTVLRCHNHTQEFVHNTPKLLLLLQSCVLYCQRTPSDCFVEHIASDAQHTNHPRIGRNHILSIRNT